MAGLIAHLHLGVSIFDQRYLSDAERALGISLGVAIIYGRFRRNGFDHQIGSGEMLRIELGL